MALVYTRRLVTYLGPDQSGHVVYVVQPSTQVVVRDLVMSFNAVPSFVQIYAITGAGAVNIFLGSGTIPAYLHQDLRFGLDPNDEIAFSTTGAGGVSLAITGYVFPS